MIHIPVIWNSGTLDYWTAPADSPPGVKTATLTRNRHLRCPDCERGAEFKASGESRKAPTSPEDQKGKKKSTVSNWILYWKIKPFFFLDFRGLRPEADREPQNRISVVPSTGRWRERHVFFPLFGELKVARQARTHAFTNDMRAAW